MWTVNSDVQAGFRNGRGTRDHIANIHWIIEKEREFQKNIYFCFIDYAKAFDYVDVPTSTQEEALFHCTKPSGVTSSPSELHSIPDFP